ncbi:alginate export family protein [Pseudomonas aeruginosa]|nr:alginate export family protein [Pseudomonas aeruginosa]RUB28867.1 alginate export family protein [Pseudomonas aeruginosa]HCD6632158.1 alginate export family protein [Pseudomonas aeruginosa]HCD7569737.1 alginate export family protein [Pseudomonas aeruginosa]HCZ9132581.1 alginate export family protein [Pseudomonas aeruginosa]
MRSWKFRAHPIPLNQSTAPVNTDDLEFQVLPNPCPFDGSAYRQITTGSASELLSKKRSLIKRLFPATLLIASQVLFSSPSTWAASAGNSLEQERPLRPGQPRWLENYRFLDDPVKRTDPFDSLRFQRLTESSWLQLGGEVRYRVDSIDKPVFGLRGVNDDSAWMQRLQAHADLHLFDDAVRAFVQVENSRAWGKDLLTPNDESKSDVHQAFLDFNRDVDSARFTARIGRQEMGYGALAFVTYRDTPNIRLAFDGARLTYAGGNGYRVDAFAVRPVSPSRDSFDDGSNNNVKFYGLYATVPLGNLGSADLYGFGLEIKERALAGVNGAEKRYTAGTRLFGKNGRYDWSWDLAGQFGHLAGAQIRAWAFVTDTGYSFDGSWRPRVGFRADGASGDRRRGDARIGTFDPLFPRNGVYGEAGLVTLSNALIAGPTVAFWPFSRVRLEPGVFQIWRQTTDDVVYLPGLKSVPGTASSSGRHVGTVYRANARWLANSNLTVDVDYSYYDVGRAISEAGGVDSSFLMTRATFRF